jgi:minor histocompatibility antigen H13
LPKSALPLDVAGAVFPKFYFYVSVVGYVVGMITTLVVLNVFNHAQPALLYLVPGVLIALWGTALCRGELKLMWNYTEASSADEGKGKDTKDSKDRDSDKENKDPEKEKDKEKENAEKERTEEKQRQLANAQAHHVFLLSLSSPRNGPKKGKLFNKSE